MKLCLEMLHCVGNFHDVKSVYHDLARLHDHMFHFTVTGCLITCTLPPTGEGSEVLCRLFCVDAEVGVDFAVCHVWLDEDQHEICLYRIQGDGFLFARVQAAFLEKFCGIVPNSMRPVWGTALPEIRGPFVTQYDAKEEQAKTRDMWANIWSMAVSRYVDVSTEGFRAVVRCACDRHTKKVVMEEFSGILRVAQQASGELQRLALLCLFHLGRPANRALECRCERSEYERLTVVTENTLTTREPT